MTDANILSSAVTPKIKRREETRKSLTNCFTGEHCFLIRELMDQYDHLQEKILKIDNELYEKAKPYAHLVAEFKKIPGIVDVLAIGILAEATTDMSNFEDERKFAA